MSTPDIVKLWEKYDATAEAIKSLGTDVAVHEQRINAIEKANNEMCLQLKTTEVRVMDSIKDSNVKLDTLIAENHRQEGAKQAVKWIPILLQIAVAFTVLIAFFNK